MLKTFMQLETKMVSGMSGFTGETLGTGLAIATLLGAQAFFVGAEYALVKARNLGLAPSAREGKGRAQLSLRIRRNLESYLATCQVGMTMVSLGLGWLGAPAVAMLVEPVVSVFDFADQELQLLSFVAGFLLLCSLHIVLGQQVPRLIAIGKPKPVSSAVVYPLHALWLLFFPLIRLLEWASQGLLACLGLTVSSGIESVDNDEARGPTEVDPGLWEQQRAETELFGGVLSFDQRPVKRVMVPRSEVEHLSLEATPAEMLKRITETKHSQLPLVEGDWENLIGVVVVREALIAALEGDGALAGIRSLARKPLMVPESERAARLFQAMRVKRADIAFVLDEYGEYVGLVTLEDLLDEVSGVIPEYLHGHEHEFDIRFVDPGWEIHGLASLADIGRITGFFPGPVDANTLSGFFMQRLERMPAVGDQWQESGFRITVLAVEHRHVELCELIKLPK